MSPKIRPDCIAMPRTPVSRSFKPQGATAYHVQDKDSWESLAKEIGVDPWQLIRYNYPTLPPDNHVAAREVNWYLQEYVGCTLVTPDHKNYRFTSDCKPGFVFLPDNACRQTMVSQGTGAGSPPVPILVNIKDRRESILKNTPAIFQVAPDPSAHSYPNPAYAKQDLEEATINWLTIQKQARFNQLDPDFVAAIVWMESTHGWYDRYDPWNKTIRPMNIHAKLWEQLGVSRSDLDNPEINIAEGTYILKAIWDRTEDPTFEKVATLYNQLGATKVNGYGKTVVFYMVHKPWQSKLGASWRQQHGIKEWKNR